MMVMRDIELYAPKKGMQITPLENKDGYLLESKDFYFTVKHNDKPKGYLLLIKEKDNSDYEKNILCKTQKGVIAEIEKILGDAVKENSEFKDLMHKIADENDEIFKQLKDK